MALSNEDIQILHKNEVTVVTELLQELSEQELNKIFEGKSLIYYTHFFVGTQRDDNL